MPSPYRMLLSRVRVTLLLLALAGAAQAGLVSYWPLDEGTGTTSANAVGGMPNASLVNLELPGDWITGHNGSGFAVRLNAAGESPLNDYVNFGTNATLDALNTTFSVETWVRTNDPGGWFRAMVAKYGLVGTQTPFWGLGWMGASGNPLGFYIRNQTGTAAQAVAPTGWGKDNLWHHVVGVRGNGSVTFFGDGEVLATAAESIGNITNPTRVISSGTHNLSQYVREDIDDVAIWNHAMTPQQALALASGAYTPLTLPPSFSKNPIEASNPAAYWRLEETIAGGGAGDWSGANYHANGYGGLTKALAHPLWYDPANRAMAFNGSSAYFSTGAAILQSDFAGDGPYSIELWFNAASRHQGAMVGITRAGSNPSEYFLLLELEPDGTIRWLHRVPPSGAATGTNLYSTTLYSTNEWHHLAVVKDGATMMMYIDGMPEPNTATDPTTVAAALDLAIGRLSKIDSSRYFSGMLDEIVLYDRALTHEEIYYHFAGILIPEPASLALLGLGALALLRRRRRGAV